MVLLPNKAQEILLGSQTRLSLGVWNIRHLLGTTRKTWLHRVRIPNILGRKKIERSEASPQQRPPAEPPEVCSCPLFGFKLILSQSLRA